MYEHVWYIESIAEKELIRQVISIVILIMRRMNWIVGYMGAFLWGLLSFVCTDSQTIVLYL